MTNENSQERTIDEIIAKVTAEAQKLSGNEISQTPDEILEPSSEAVLSDWRQVEDHLNVAIQNAHTGTQLLSMSRFNIGFRFIARIMGRIVLFLSQIITVPQRVFNQNIFSAVQSGFENLRDNIRVLEGRDSRILALEKICADNKVLITELEDNLVAEIKNRNTALQIGLEERDQWLHNQQGEIAENKKWLHNQQDEIAENKEWTGNLEKRAESIEEKLSGITDKLSDRDKLRKLEHVANERLKSNLTLQERRLDLLIEEVRKRLPEPLNSNQLETFTDQASHLLDPLYVHFEDQYRGTRQEVKDKLSIYLPLILKADAGVKERPVLDIGCGRGEWLELLKNENLTAKGLDLNQVSVEQCKKRGLEVVQSDVFDYLATIADESLGAVTGFHFIEHISFNNLVKLLDEALRVLKTGGLIIFETPNPRNILVGSGDFYRDPTHRNPIHPETISSVAEARGFVKVYSYFLIKQPDGIEFVEAKKYRFDIMDDYINVSRDFSLIGYKA